MAGYSIFEGTIADMAWPAVEEAGRRNAAIMVPVAVIEQHGPHLPLATDTYGAYLLCAQISKALADAGIEAVVAPPYFLGMNSTTRMFPGSLDISRSTMMLALGECLQNYASWGFSRQFVLNHHGDPNHNAAIIEVVRAARKQGIEAAYTIGGFTRSFIEEAYVSYFKEPLPTSDQALLVAEESEETRTARIALTKSSWGIHAEERETSMIMRWFPDTLTDAETISTLPAMMPTLPEFDAAVARDGWRQLSPLGYFGDPAVATSANGELYRLEAMDMAAAIARRLGN
jgi:creatinine amidohydrolase